MNTPEKRLEQFYLEAAAATYAGGTVKKETITDLPRSKVYRYESGDLLYVDTFFTNGENSGGQTVIYVDGVPAWLMQYHGWCKDDDKNVLTFLKKALSAAYERGEFHGGRGLPRFESHLEDGFFYENFPQMPPYQQDFICFQGRERIWRKPVREVDVFWHRYQGILLATP